jgi:hypothetical protein
VASAAERVIVMMKSVATNPSSTSTNSLPCHHDSPLQHRDRALAMRALGRDPAVDREGAEQGEQDQQDGRDGDSTPAARAAMPGW